MPGVDGKIVSDHRQQLGIPLRFPWIVDDNTPVVDFSTCRGNINKAPNNYRIFRARRDVASSDKAANLKNRRPRDWKPAGPNVSVLSFMPPPTLPVRRSLLLVDC
ncbi:uncharacterized protein CLUP02_11557 [Colletotrichum lupini]|uniref:Uncharacterized protein n=1 Tax=Colletotrichum lupini TaxID=145971 RepID=A0A9Q8SZF9_9PEZI|nr:uncharacterized protein CLUP02_11557 [Colletotrichum lupini]UQC86058.1 hypothetical protein CLUP02_11557 [Colletotrichum lupini]